jgi:hypothetical protein
MFDVNSVEYRRAAMAINFDLEALFNRNMAFFKSEDVNLYNIFSVYKPKELVIRLDPKGYLNLVNIKTKQAVYPINPVDYAVKQVDLFLKNRARININLKIHPFEYDDFIYTQALTTLDDAYNELNKGKIAEEYKSSVPMLFMYGGGMFLQLEPLLNNLDIKRLTILEPNNDSFYASLHLIDWSEIYRYFDRDGYNLNLTLIGDNNKSLTEIRSYVTSIGFHHFPRFEFYEHYNNPDLTAHKSEVMNLLKITVSSSGYYDDERIGLAHSLVNLQNGSGYLKKCLENRSSKKQLPVFIIGNGPSLDEQFDFICKNMDKAIVISCGTALGTLIKKGVKPDIHIEQERLAVVAENIINSTTKEDRAGIVLLALNPCHPSVFALFDESYVVNKREDLGTSFVNWLKKEQVDSLTHCNPVIANFGLSASLSLGFDDIYLFGVDCGMKDDTKHHSSDSVLHYSSSGEDEARRKKIFASGSFEVPGNRGGKVITTPTLNFSRIQLEALLSVLKPKCVNTSNGAKIHGADYIDLDNHRLADLVENKATILSELLLNNFEKYNITSQEVADNLLQMKSIVVNCCNSAREYYMAALDNDDDVLLYLDKIDKIYNAYYDNNKAIYLLLSGSFRGLSFKLSTARFSFDKENYQAFKNVFRGVINDYINGIIDHCDQGFLKYH